MSSRATLDDAAFETLRELIRSRSGISIAPEKRYLIETRLAELLVEESIGSFGALAERLRLGGDPRLRDLVVDAMTTNETHWFRDESPWALLRGLFLPRACEELASGRRSRIRIWSAACSTGQEPYSIAIAILEHLVREKSPLGPEAFQIVGSDLSSAAVRTARAGRYRGPAIERGLEPALRDRHFEADGDDWVVSQPLRDLVRLERRNLMEPFGELGHFDLVFCRNVLIYFAPDLKRDILTRIGKTLFEGGALVLGSSESLQGLMGRFQMKQFQGNFYYVRAEGEEP